MSLLPLCLEVGSDESKCREGLRVTFESEIEAGLHKGSLSPVWFITTDTIVASLDAAEVNRRLGRTSRRQLPGVSWLVSSAQHCFAVHQELSRIVPQATVQGILEGVIAAALPAAPGEVGAC